MLDLLLVVGFLSMAVGGVIALTRDRLKQLLAYSTISQYGYVVVLIGLGTEEAAVAAGFYVIAHALAKSALFLTAGTVTEATGTTHLLSSAVSGGRCRCWRSVAAWRPPRSPRSQAPWVFSRMSSFSPKPRRGAASWPSPR